MEVIMSLRPAGQKIEISGLFDSLFQGLLLFMSEPRNAAGEDLPPLSDKGVKSQRVFVIKNPIFVVPFNWSL